MVRYDGLTKAEVLCALYNRAKCNGMGIMHYIDKNLTLDEAEQLLSLTVYFDYLYGRILKVDLSDDNAFDEFLYDRDNGKGAAQTALDNYKIEKIRKSYYEI